MAETHQLTFYRLCQQLYCIQGAKFSRVHWKCFCPFNSFSDSEVARQFDEADSSEKKQLQPLAFLPLCLHVSQYATTQMKAHIFLIWVDPGLFPDFYFIAKLFTNSITTIALKTSWACPYLVDYACLHGRD